MYTDPGILIKDGERAKAMGSLLIVKAETIEEVRKMMTSDIYYTSGVVSFFTSHRHLFDSNTDKRNGSGITRSLQFTHFYLQRRSPIESIDKMLNLHEILNAYHSVFMHCLRFAFEVMVTANAIAELRPGQE